ncbi:denticleless protein [Trifolium repens]|nr:denticleless protein [Trifolium repens]
MATPNSKSIFNIVTSRELNSFKVHGIFEMGALATQHNDIIPLALSFAKPSCYEENADNARICEWSAHNNAVFGVNWIKDDTQILTASGDQTVISVTSALWLKDEISIATAGAADSVLKFWDTRNSKSIVTQACPQPESTGKQILHGISSLSQDDSGFLLSASCMDSQVYLYNTLQLEKGPLRHFEGGLIN